MTASDAPRRPIAPSVDEIGLGVPAIKSARVAIAADAPATMPKPKSRGSLVTSAVVVPAGIPAFKIAKGTARTHPSRTLNFPSRTRCFCRSSQAQNAPMSNVGTAITSVMIPSAYTENTTGWFAGGAVNHPMLDRTLRLWTRRRATCHQSEREGC